MYSVHSRRIPIHDHKKDVDVSNISLLSESANNSPMVPFSGEHSLRVSPESTNLDYLHVPFTNDEIIKYTRTMEEGYDISTDSRYNYWLSLHPMSTSNSQMSHQIIATIYL